MRFFLGTHIPAWVERTDVPLFISRHKLMGRKSFPRARAGWALDSGGFTTLSQHGEWTLSPKEYVDEVRLYREAIGNLEWAAPQDWMVEPWIVRKTGLSVDEHQHRTVRNLIDLRMLAPDVPFIPVLQGWEPDDYARIIEAYDTAGIDLTKERVVGVGSVCRRQGTQDAVRVFDAIDRALRGLPLHGFGFKTLGLGQLQNRMASADSMAWSFRARRSPPLPGHEARHKACANCMAFALKWRDELLASLSRKATILRQPHLL